MYILIRDVVPDDLAPLIAAHASLACFREFEDNSEMQKWINGVFKKVICRVNDSEYTKAREATKYVELTESDLDDMIVCSAFCPREEYPKVFQFLKMWRTS